MNGILMVVLFTTSKCSNASFELKLKTGNRAFKLLSVTLPDCSLTTLELRKTGSKYFIQLTNVFTNYSFYWTTCDRSTNLQMPLLTLKQPLR